MSPSPELEELRTRKAELEEESRSLEQKQTALTERVEILEEKLAINGLENNKQNRQESIKRLESKIEELEQQLTKTPAGPEPSIESSNQFAEVTEPTHEEATEATVTVVPIEEPQIVNEAEDFAETMKRQQEKKKRRLF